MAISQQQKCDHKVPSAFFVLTAALPMELAAFFMSIQHAKEKDNESF